jgi:hypothetical protein
MTAIAPLLYATWRIAADGWPAFAAVFRQMSLEVSVAQRGAGNSIEALRSAPLFWTLVVAGLACVLYRRERPLFWYSILAALFLVAFFLRNPFVYPYNFVLLVPVAAPMFLGFRGNIVAVALCVYAVVAGAAGAQRILQERNGEQVRFVKWLWRGTDASEGVFDWQGMHFGRRGVKHWFIYGANADLYRHGWYSIADELQRANVTMILPNYRFDWLTPADRAFIDSHYLYTARCVMSPGVALRGSGSVDVVFAGVYAVQPAKAVIDGVTVDDRVRLARGMHRVETSHPLALLYTTKRREDAGPAPCPAGPLIYNF